MKLLAVTALVASASAAECTYLKMPSTFYSDAKCTTEKTATDAEKKTLEAAIKLMNTGLGAGKCSGAGTTYSQVKCDGDTLEGLGVIYSDDKCTKKAEMTEEQKKMSDEMKKKVGAC